MTNTDLLRQTIDRSGLKISYICKKLGMTSQGLYSKLRNGNEWNYTQVVILKDILNLSNEEVDNIFFINDVEHLTTQNKGSRKRNRS